LVGQDPTKFELWAARGRTRGSFVPAHVAARCVDDERKLYVHISATDTGARGELSADSLRVPVHRELRFETGPAAPLITAWLLRESTS